MAVSLLINYEGNNILCSPKPPSLLPWKAETFVNLNSYGWCATYFPKNVQLQLCQDSTLLWIGRCIMEKFCSSSFQRQYCNFCLEYIFWKVRILLQQFFFFLQLLFSFIAVVQKRKIPRKVSWRVKSENTFTPADLTFLTEVAFTCNSTAKNKIQWMKMWATSHVLLIPRFLSSGSIAQTHNCCYHINKLSCKGKRSYMSFVRLLMEAVLCRVRNGT